MEQITNIHSNVPMLVDEESLLLRARRLQSGLGDELLLLLEDVVSFAEETLANVQCRLQCNILRQGKVLGDLRTRNSSSRFVKRLGAIHERRATCTASMTYRFLGEEVGQTTTLYSLRRDRRLRGLRSLGFEQIRKVTLEHNRADRGRAPRTYPRRRVLFSLRRRLGGERQTTSGPSEVARQ